MLPMTRLYITIGRDFPASDMIVGTSKNIRNKGTVTDTFTVLILQ